MRPTPFGPSRVRRSVDLRLPMQSHDADRAQLSRARQLIEELGESSGLVEQEYWDRCDDKTREKFSNVISGLVSKLEPAVVALAKSLYSSNARFVFELLQNAEDNHFRSARSKNQLPYISFYMRDDRLVVDCNEDGFNEANLRAICSIGQSSKPAAEGYIGEKGIGFKSVFMAAWKVHIQSGVYSFYFKHRKTDPGMGMVQPMWQDPVEELPPNLTRMTLYLHEDDDPEYTTAQRSSIRQQLRELSGDVLLFMRKLREIRITIDEGGTKRSTVFSKGKEKQNRIAIFKKVTENGNTETSTTFYHITKCTAYPLSKNENRTYTEHEERVRAWSSADVVLAFPLSPESVPIIEPQKVFAFLPVQSAGFPFLIQSDFMTSASREGIVVTAARNTQLLDAIADAFIQAALQFCDHPKLQYTWVRFLPNGPRNTYEAFWSRLVTKIEDRMRKVPLIRPNSEGPLRIITQLCQLRPDCTDKHNNLLLRDLDPEICLSRRYQGHDVAVLRRFGLRRSSWSDFIKMVDKDLKASTSWIRSRSSDDYLQSRVAYLLAETYTNTKHSITKASIQALALLPLQDGRWLAAHDLEQAFFPDTEGLTIPEDLQFNLIETSAAAQAQRRTLFQLLGVESLSIDCVRKRILERHCFYYRHEPGMTVQIIIDQLKFLYSTHQVGVHSRQTYSDVVVIIDRTFFFRRPAARDIYLPDDNPLGPRELLKPGTSDNELIREAPGFEVDFLLDTYLQNVPDKPQRDSPSWQDWLVECVGLRRLLRLTNMDSTQPDLSEACYYVAKHRPEKFVAFLVHHWDQEGGPIAESWRLRQQLRQIEVLCQGDGDSDGMLPLQDTYLPLAHLQSVATRFLAKDTDFPFLQLEEPPEQNHVSKEWDPLISHLGIGYKEDLKFYLKILTELSYVDANYIYGYRRIFELYTAIYGQYLQSVTKELDLEIIQSYFKERRTILVPLAVKKEPTWASSWGCLWKAPSSFVTMYPLQARLQTVLQDTSSIWSSLSSFFKDVLKIRDCCAFDIVDELSCLRDNGYEEIAVYELYRQLSSMTQALSVSDQEAIRSLFTDWDLIYTNDERGGAWHPVSECLWSSETEIHGLTTLEPHYEALYDFFVDFIGVKTLNLELVYDELVRLGSSSEATREQIERHIWILNSFIPAAVHLPDARKLLKCRILPVRYPDGEVKLENLKTEFIIVDRKSLGDIFSPLVKTLDFDLEQVRKLEPTLRWLRLETRFLSDAFWEDSRVESPSKQPLSSPKRRISPKAHALYRIAYHYDSPRLGRTLYETLKNAQVYETDGIASTLHVRQDGQTYSHDKSRSDLHIEYRNEQLDIFVPRDKKRQESCYTGKLPLRLFEWLVGDPGTGIKNANQKGIRVAARVLNASRSILSDILEEEGIALGDLEDDYPESDEDSESERFRDAESHNTGTAHLVEGANDVPVTTYSSDGNNSATPRLAETDTEAERPGLSIPTFSQVASPSRQHALPGQWPATITARRHEPQFALPSVQASSPEPSLSSDRVRDVSYVQARTGLVAASRRVLFQAASTLMGTVDSETAQYRALLERVVTAARARSGLPSQGPFNMTGMSEALSDLAGYNGYDGLDESSRFRSSSQFERDKKIGAAGELYVFELLKNLHPDLPGFSEENWQSSIRRYVSVHPDYASIKNWGHKETSDLIYDDVEGVLTELLIDNGYLERSVWEHKRPSYHLEVKTTTGPSGVPFYMSKNQYRLMHACRNDTEKIYVVFRVFEVDKAMVNVRLYVDPAAQEESNHLVFTEGTWSVTPGDGTPTVV